MAYVASVACWGEMRPGPDQIFPARYQIFPTRDQILPAWDQIFPARDHSERIFAAHGSRTSARCYDFPARSPKSSFLEVKLTMRKDRKCFRYQPIRMTRRPVSACHPPGIGEVGRSRTSPRLHHNMMLSALPRLEVATVICVSPTATYVGHDNAFRTASELQIVLQQARRPNFTGKFPGAQVLFTTAALRVPEGMPVTPETRPYSEGLRRQVQRCCGGEAIHPFSGRRVTMGIWAVSLDGSLSFPASVLP